MNELYDYLQQKIGQEDCPIVSIHPVFGIRENYFELVMKDDSTIKITEKQTRGISHWIFGMNLINNKT